MIKEQCLPAVLLTLFLALLTGIVFPLVIWGLSQILVPYEANGSLVTKDGTFVGSVLIGQAFSSARYFHPRPSAAGTGYDPLLSGGTNLGPTSKKLFAGQPDDPATKDVDESYTGIGQLAKEFRETNGLPPDALLPADAVTRSASGLDPHISPRNAQLQAVRVARERGLRLEDVKALISKNTERRFLGIFGESRVNVLSLNLALDSVCPQTRKQGPDTIQPPAPRLRRP